MFNSSVFDYINVLDRAADAALRSVTSSIHGISFFEVCAIKRSVLPCFKKISPFIDRKTVFLFIILTY